MKLCARAGLSSHLSASVSDSEFAAVMAPFQDRRSIAIAVSGGADSMALLHLLKRWTSANGVALTALTVDHELRAESAAEAKQVGTWCADMGVAHEILIWSGEKPKRRIQEVARRERYALLQDWCIRMGVADLFVGHSRNDQAETFLFRMSRGSGPEGLSGMPLVYQRDCISVIRPLLNIERSRLETTLRLAGQEWIDDPGNADERFARVRVRQKVKLLEGHGVPVSTVSETARIFANLRRTRETCVSAVATRSVTLYPEGYADIDRRELKNVNNETAIGIVSALLKLIGGRDFAPKRARQATLCRALVDPGKNFVRTLGSCVIAAEGDRVRLWREFGTISDKVSLEGPSPLVWDGRFLLHINPSKVPNSTFISALGRSGWEEIAGDVGTKFRRIPGPVRYGLPAVRREKVVLQVWHLGYRSERVSDDIIENAAIRARTPILQPPFWVA